MTFQLREILECLEPEEILGSYAGDFHAIDALSAAKRGCVSFVEHSKYYKYLQDTEASLVIVPLDCPHLPKENQVFVKVKDPALTLLEVSKLWVAAFAVPLHPGIHPTAVVDSTAQVHESATVGPWCVIGRGARIQERVHLVAQVFIGSNVEIGPDSHLMPHVVVSDRCVLGARVILQSGVVIGGDGFGYHTHQGVHYREPQIGNVVIEDDVEIGNHTTVDRARFSSTRIGRGTKIDNLVQIAHNVQIGKGSILVAQCGIAGGTVLGDYVVVGGQAGIVGHMKIGDGTMIGAQSGINHSLPPKSYVRGTPSLPVQQAMRLHALHQRLPEFIKKLTALEARVDALMPSSEMPESSQ